MLYEILKTSKLGASFAPDMYTALWAQKLARDGEVKTLSGIPPLTFPSNGQPLLDYLISGNTFQSTPPTPDNPIMPQECGDTTGNLVRFYQEEMQGNFYGVDVTVRNAEITLNGTVTVGSGHWVEIGYKFGEGTVSTDNVVIPCESETPYTIAIEILEGNSSQVRLIAFGTSNENRTVNIGSSLTTTFSDDINRIFISLGAGGVVFNNLKFRVMFNKGSTALPYEPYGIKIPISSANTTTPIYLGEVETTRKVKRLVLTGDETWDEISGNAPYRIQLPDIVQTSDKDIVLFTSTHYLAVSNNASWTQYTTCVSWTFLGGVNVKCLVFRDRNQATLADFKAYLAAQYAAGTPVTVWHVLATEETAVVNEPLMRIGDYADTVSKAQAGVEIPTARGTNTLDVLTDVKPSEIYIKYKS